MTEHWSNHAINIPNAESAIRHVSGPDEQSREVGIIISEHSDPFGMVGIINNGTELIPCLKSELKNKSFYRMKMQPIANLIDLPYINFDEYYIF